MNDPLLKRLRARRMWVAAKYRFRRYVYRDGGPTTQWQRVVMNRRIADHVSGLHPESCEAIEISGRTHAGYPWKSYLASEFRHLDICDPPASVPQYDVVLCEQVLEHVADPWRAVETLYDLCRPGGAVVVSTPFLIRVHPTPLDCWRFTEDGLRRLLEGRGFVVDKTDSWGNKRCVHGNLRRFPPMAPWRSLRNDPLFPLQVWAFAHRPELS
ncbi:MAG TPA: methyltransferase domain-containing protein [Acidimicrobiia bacterium]|nr:methyltransferase domain-containing protein [Acidimicrobiia bacterium]